ENAGATEQRFGYQLVGPAGLVEPATSRPAGVTAEMRLKDAQGGFGGSGTAGPQIVKDWKDKKNPGTLQVDPPPTNNAFFGPNTKYFCAVVLPVPGSKPIDSVRTMPLLELAGREATAEEKKLAETPGETSIAAQATVVGVVRAFVVPPGTTLSQDYTI